MVAMPNNMSDSVPARIEPKAQARSDGCSPPPPKNRVDQQHSQWLRCLNHLAPCISPRSLNGRSTRGFHERDNAAPQTHQPVDSTRIQES